MLENPENAPSPFAFLARTRYACEVFASFAIVVLPFEAVTTVLVFAGLSFDSIKTSVIVFPPVAGTTQEMVSRSTPAVAVGFAGVPGTVVAVAAFAATAFVELSK